MTNYVAQVDAGIAWLDTNRPCWRSLLDIGSLNMAHVDRCVLGQTGGYTAACADAVPYRYCPGGSWEARDLWADAHGFRLPDSVQLIDWATAYDALTAEWLTRL